MDQRNPGPGPARGWRPGRGVGLAAGGLLAAGLALAMAVAASVTVTREGREPREGRGGPGAAAGRDPAEGGQPGAEADAPSAAGQPGGGPGAPAEAGHPGAGSDAPAAGLPPPAEDPAADWVPYDGPVEHIFFHPLIVYPELAFDGDFMAQGYDDWFVTVPEFQAILGALYQRGYVLVGVGDLFEERVENGRTVLVRKELRLPPGKRPLVLSIDDLNYYAYMRENGNAHRLVVDDDGRVAALVVTPRGQRFVSRRAEIVPILDDFVAAHPDFSLNGAKGIIALTGYEGILGYATHDPAAPGYEAERREALRVVERLKATGWSFASHGWGHRDAARIRLESLVADTDRWKREVESLVGPTPVYIFPFGSGVRPGDPKFEALLERGFRILCGVGPRPYLEVTDRYAWMDRRHIDGLALRTQGDLLRELFDPEAVVDPARPWAPPGAGRPGRTELESLREPGPGFLRE
ncbi:MAG: hypothetical protein DIU70_006160 [Bacillota bacterium]